MNRNEFQERTTNNRNEFVKDRKRNTTKMHFRTKKNGRIFEERRGKWGVWASWEGRGGRGERREGEEDGEGGWGVSENE